MWKLRIPRPVDVEEAAMPGGPGRETRATESRFGTEVACLEGAEGSEDGAELPARDIDTVADTGTKACVPPGSDG